MLSILYIYQININIVTPSVVTPSERLVRHSSHTEEKHWSLQAITEEM